MFTEIIIGIVVLIFLGLVGMLVWHSIQQRADDKKARGEPKVEPKEPDWTDDPTPVQQAPVVKPITRPVADQRRIETDKIIKSIVNKPETVRFVSDDEIKFRAYMIASADGFKGDAQEYWIQAEKELKGTK
jgi:hypothetical protein